MSRIESPYPNGCRGAVSLTFDDGSRTQLENAVPVLNERGLKGTFYIHPRGSSPEADDWMERLAPWREVAAAGHEIGNHSLSHICSSRFCDAPMPPCLEEATLELIEADVLEAERRLRIGIGETERSFAYPCYESHVGAGPTRQSYVPVIARHFRAARSVGEFANHPATCDLHCLWSHRMEQMSGPQMVGLAAQAASTGRWAVLTFHTVGIGGLPVFPADLAELCDYLANHRDEIWVAPVIEVAERIIAWRQKVERQSGG